MVSGNGQRGFAILYGILMIFLLGVSGLLVGRHLEVRQSELLTEVRTVRLIALSDAAMARSLAHLDEEASLRELPPLALDGAEISAEIERADGLWVVRACATENGWAATVTAQVAGSPGSIRVTSWSRRVVPVSGRG